MNNSCQVGQNAAVQSFEIWNSGGGTLGYSLASNADWLSCTPNNGSSTGGQASITVNYHTAGLSAGTHQAAITITGGGASNSPRTIPVTLTVNPPGIITILDLLLDNN